MQLHFFAADITTVQILPDLFLSSDLVHFKTASSKEMCDSNGSSSGQDLQCITNYNDKAANSDRQTAEDLMRNANEINQIHAEVYRARSKPPDRSNFESGKEYIAAMSSQLFELLDLSKSVLMSSASRKSAQKDIGMSTVIQIELLLRSHSPQSPFYVMPTSPGPKYAVFCVLVSSAAPVLSPHSK